MHSSQIFAILALGASAALAAPAQLEARWTGGSTCSSGSVYCENVGKFSSNSQECSTGSAYCCSSKGLVDALNCVNLLDGTTVNVDLSDLLGGLVKRNDQPDCSTPPPPPPPTPTPSPAPTPKPAPPANNNNVCSSGSVYCKNGGSWSSNTQSCASGDAYCCKSSGTLNAANCLNILDGTTINVDLGDLLGL